MQRLWDWHIFLFCIQIVSGSSLAELHLRLLHISIPFHLWLPLAYLYLNHKNTLAYKPLNVFRICPWSLQCGVYDLITLYTLGAFYTWLLVVRSILKCNKHKKIDFTKNLFNNNPNQLLCSIQSFIDMWDLPCLDWVLIDLPLLSAFTPPVFSLWVKLTHTCVSYRHVLNNPDILCLTLIHPY